MKKFLEVLKNIWSIEELKNKLLLTLGLLFVYRLGSNVVLPGINPESLSALQQQTDDNNLLGILNAFTGGAFANASIMALGIMPYISASIVIQLLGIAVPSIQKLDKEGESGRRKKNNYTRFLTIFITLAQAPGYLANLIAQQVEITISPSTFWFLGIIVLVTGTIFAMWLGERITDKGIGNGISLLIMIGIIATLPQAFLQELITKLENQTGGLPIFLVEIAALFVVILLSVALVSATRKIPVQYARRVAGGRLADNQITRSYIPLKVNAAGVMPIIFAQAIMFIPITVLTYAGSTESTGWIVTLFGNISGFWYNFLFAVLIILFTYFYTAIQINTNQMAEDLKRNGGFIPGIKPGKPTAEYIDLILSRITLPGSIFLALIAILPAFAMSAGVTTQFAYFYGGTSLVIMVGVIIDTLQQIESYLLARHYDGLIQSGRIRGRSSVSVE
ncbi:preprotein translocase subunit SecY [Schleiferia thermophila]|jgi:preprotein translocase subunit SecY|uniref:Protein translocase subunit SecY n=1 Tax=Schleiferia thermophila TaxID=884107 RepID=A0A369A6D8_9FLAO|nr:preprotein translocase subunit SecY [Schleiferia thermophila]KFD38347.1 preprotein translocase subunit SecY [Schleiferia thermophila str. Yellowstone]RCX04839.1 protein translocase subunit secY/sec61 alpha [Schleiferia thermophila]GCD79634.1 protein translocase subunit SecY [Schleiferia thermophila]